MYVRVSCERSKPIWSQIDWNRFEVPCERSECLGHYHDIALGAIMISPWGCIHLQSYFFKNKNFLKRVRLFLTKNILKILRKCYSLKFLKHSYLILEYCNFSKNILTFLRIFLLF